MKEDELRKLSTCCVCDQKIGETGNPMFYVLQVESFILDMRALQRQQGLAMQLSGNGLLASIMGPNEDLAKRVGEFPKVMICLDCGTSNSVILSASNAIDDAFEEEEREA